MFQFQQKLKNIKFHIKQWNQFTFGNILQEKTALNKAMIELQQKIITEGRTEQLSEQETHLQSQILERDKQEEVLWKKKSQVRWLKEGEKNTKFFHRSTIQRRMINTITHIQNIQGERVEDHAAIEQELLTYFKQVHHDTQTDRTEAIDKIIKSIRKIITKEHNQLLLKLITLQEV